MQIQTMIFVNPRYWPEATELETAIQELRQELAARLPQGSPGARVIDSEPGPGVAIAGGSGGVALFVAMSGGVQSWMMQAAENYFAIGMVPAYEPGLTSPGTAEWLLERNASPSTLEVFSVLKNRGKPVFWLRQEANIAQFARAARAVLRLRSTKIILVGETEPWVLSATRDPEVLRKNLGLQVQPVSLDELFDLFQDVTDADATEIAQRWLAESTALIEPQRQDVFRASRLIVAFRRLLDRYQATGVAIACFAMLQKFETTSCLAMSYFNDLPEYMGACEGDLDAASTLILAKALSQRPAWMGNPIVGSSDAISLVHCTAPLQLTGVKQPFKLRSHHESGIGVSPEVDLPAGEQVTMCRIGKGASAMSIHLGTTAAAPRQRTCRTQLHIQLDSANRFLENSLGNHQVLLFGDYARELRYCAGLLGLEVYE